VTRYEADVNRLATQLAAMVTAPGVAATASDADTVNRARLGLRHWCRQLLNDLTPAQHTLVAAEPRLADLATHPVGTLQNLLVTDPAPLQLRDHKDAAIAETANRRWARLGHDIELATHSWATADPASRPTGERAWSTVADVSAVAETAAVLDRQLIDQHPGNEAARLLRESAEIGIAAQYVRRIAASGSLPPPQPLQPAAQRLQPVPVPTIGDLPGALTNLGMLVTTAPHLRPRTVTALAGAHIPTLELLADAITADPPPTQRAGRRRFATALRAHGHTLENLRVAARPLRSIDVEDRRPTVQAQAITELTTRLRDRAPWSDPRAQQAGLASLLPALAVTPALAKAATASVRAGRWFEPAAGARLRWRKVSYDHPVTEAVELAIAHARGLMGQLPPPKPARSPFRSPHEVLAPQLLYTDRVRPSSPTTPAPAL
jgi:hypothetical protein